MIFRENVFFSILYTILITITRSSVIDSKTRKKRKRKEKLEALKRQYVI